MSTIATILRFPSMREKLFGLNVPGNCLVCSHLLHCMQIVNGHIETKKLLSSCRRQSNYSIRISHRWCVEGTICYLLNAVVKLMTFVVKFTQVTRLVVMWNIFVSTRLQNVFTGRYIYFNFLCSFLIKSSMCQCHLQQIAHLPHDYISCA